MDSSFSDQFFIKGLIGGGYKPANNFKLSDLSPEMRADLGAARPDFAATGQTPEIAHIIEILELDADAWQEEEQRLVIRKWASGADFLRAFAGYDGAGIVDLYLGTDTPIPPSNREILAILEDESKKKRTSWEGGERVSHPAPDYLRNFALRLAYENPNHIPADFDIMDKGDSIEQLFDSVTNDGELTTEYFNWVHRDYRTEKDEPAPTDATEALRNGIEAYEITQPHWEDAESEIDAALEYLSSENEYGTELEYTNGANPAYQTLSLDKAKQYANLVDNGERVPDWDRDINFPLGDDWYNEDRYGDSLKEHLDTWFGELPLPPPGFSFPDPAAEIPWTVPPEQGTFEFPGKGRKITSLRNLLFKEAQVPEGFEGPESPVSRQHDLVNRVLQWYIDNRTEEMSWRDFQKKFPFAQNSLLFTQIRRNGPVVTRAQLQDWLDTEEPAEKDYGIAYERHYDPEQSFRDVEQLVLQINYGASAKGVLEEDPMLGQYVEYVGLSSARSGHPAGEGTVGWLRVDFVDKDWLLVDEVQSDLINSVSQAKAIVRAESFQGFLAHLENDHVRQQVIAKMNEGVGQILQQQGEEEEEEEGVRRGRRRPTQREKDAIIEQRYQMGRNKFVEEGYTEEELERIRRRLTGLFKDWTEYAISSLLEIAREHGIKYVAIHTSESIAGRDPSVEADKVKMYYDTLAKSFGFSKQTVSLGGQQKDFWVRQASKKS